MYLPSSNAVGFYPSFSPQTTLFDEDSLRKPNSNMMYIHQITHDLDKF